MGRILVIGFTIVTTMMPVAAYAAITCNSDGTVTGSLVPCGYDCNDDGVVKSVPTGTGGERFEQCTLNSLVILAQKLINFLIFWLAAPIAAVMFMYAGFLMLTNNGNESKITQAKSIFGAVFWGLIVAVAAWLVITFILDFFRLAPEFRVLI